MLRYILLAVLGVCLAGFAHGDADEGTERRLALLISNGAYAPEVGALTNTYMDAETLSIALAGPALGFKVTVATDLDEDGMYDAIDAFEAEIEAAARAGETVTAFFYYSGHGAATQVDNRTRNFLIPVGEGVTNARQLIRRGVRLDELLQSFARTQADAFFVVSDACRNELAVTLDKSVASKGFERVAQRSGMLVAYATAAGATTPDDGLFARVLAEEIVKPGETITNFYKALSRVATRREIDSQPFMAPGKLPDPHCLAGCPDREAEIAALETELSAQRAEIEALKAQVIAATAPANGRASAEEEARKAAAVENAFRSGNAAETTAIRELAAGNVETGLAELEAAARQIEADAIARAAANWRDLGALAYDSAPLRALAAYREATRLDPSHFWSWIFLSRLELRHGGDVVAARTAARAAQAVTATERERSVALNDLGNAALLAGDLTAARAVYEEGLELARALAAANPESAEARRDVSVSLKKLGDVEFESGDLAAARAVYEEGLALAHALAHALAAANPESAEARRDVSISLEKLGDVERQTGNLAAARAAYEEKLELARALAGANPESAEARRDVSVSLNKLGDVERQAGDLAAARASYEEGLELRRAFAAANPESAQARRDVSVSLERLGDVERQAGDLAAARMAHEEGLELRRALAGANPESAQARRDVIVSLDKMARVTGDVAFWREALEIAEDMAARGQLAPVDAFIPGYLKEQIAAAASSAP